MEGWIRNKLADDSEDVGDTHKDILSMKAILDKEISVADIHLVDLKSFESNRVSTPLPDLEKQLYNLLHLYLI
jgi:hypothetical protein